MGGALEPTRWHPRNWRHPQRHEAPTNGTTKATWFVRDPNQKLISMSHADDTKKDLFYLFDGLGSIAATTGIQGQLVKALRVRAYGQELNVDAADDNPWRYAGGYYDTKTGMLKYGTRYYMPEFGNFGGAW